MKEESLTFGDYLIAVLFGVTIIVVAAQVVFRYLLNDSLTWSEELSRYLFTWMTFIGAALAIRDGTHIRINLLSGRLSRKPAWFLRMGGYMLIMVFLGFLAFTGFGLVRITGNTLSPALSLPLNYVYYAALPVSAVLALGFTLRRLITVARTGYPEEED